ncbi:MAG: hypothetical protein NTY66_00855 [Candidatus Vogelbacteria bacterium]|nr:hypothetical protein [Candidatus Vogelbacteria bacterium]
METLAKSDIFFFVTTVVVILIGIGAVIAFAYVINILRDVKDVSKTVKRETTEIAGDLDTMRSKAKSGQILAGLYGFIKGLFIKRKKGRK